MNANKATAEMAVSHIGLAYFSATELKANTATNSKISRSENLKKLAACIFTAYS